MEADVEGRIDVDQLQAALFFDFIAERAVLEAGENELVVAPDELIGPPLGLAPAGVEEHHLVGVAVPLAPVSRDPKGSALRAGCVARRFRAPLRVAANRGGFDPGLVDLLDGLERQDDVADFAGLAVPDQFDLALVIEEKEAVFVVQRLVGLEVADDVLLLGLSQSRHVNPD
jgi:hypothetical protein